MLAGAGGGLGASGVARDDGAAQARRNACTAGRWNISRASTYKADVVFRALARNAHADVNVHD